MVSQVSDAFATKERVDPNAVWNGSLLPSAAERDIFASPRRICEQAWEHRWTILGHAWRTYWITMVGFAIAVAVGVLLGFLMGSSRLAYSAMYPLTTGFDALPKAAFVPSLVVWFGIGAGPAILTALLISAGSSMQMGRAFAGLVVVGAMAMGRYELFSAVEKRTTGWAHRGSNAA
jgi:ABC-type nitrate/sulfonate/bicarbonate transport system permease component